MLLEAERAPNRGVVLKVMRLHFFQGCATGRDLLLRRVIYVTCTKASVAGIQSGAVAEPERVSVIQSELDLSSASANQWLPEAVFAAGNPNDFGADAINLDGLHSVLIGLHEL